MIERQQPRPDTRSEAQRFTDDESALREDQDIKDRENRTIEINSNGVWLVDHHCGYCLGNMMIGGTKAEPKVFCPRCHVQVKQEFLGKYLKGAVQ